MIYAPLPPLLTCIVMDVEDPIDPDTPSKQA